MLVCASAVPTAAQELSGRILELGSERPVAFTAVFLLDSGRGVAESVLSDSVGRFRIEAPRAGDFYLFAERFGYFETESPLLSLEAGARYQLDVELRPEPIRLDPLGVTVRNEELLRWYTLSFGQNPAALPGFRVIQGARLEEARLKSQDNTELLRWLYVPVSHGIQVCVGWRVPRVERGTGRISEPPCGSLWIDGVQIPPEHIESIDKSTIAAVVLFDGSVELFTYGFDWSSRPARTRRTAPAGTRGGL